MSYARLYKNLDWIIATGIPFDILDKKIAIVKDNLFNEYFRYIYFTLFIKLFILFVLCFTLYFLKNKTTKYLFESLINSHNDLEQANIKLNEATKCANVGIWKWNIQENTLEWNDEMFNIYEIDSKTSILNYELWLNTIYSKDKEFTLKNLEDSLKNKEKFLATFRINTNSGIKYIKTTANAFYDNKGNPISMIGVNFDITTLKEYELQQIQLLEQAKLASLGEMIGNIAHQWRQPLSVISTASSGLKLQKEENILSDELFFSEIDTINLNIKYLNETIETFRNFLSEDKIYSEVNIKDRIYQTFEIVNATLKNSEIKLIHNLEDIDDKKMKIVLGELSQVLINILNNAKDAFIEKNTENPIIEVNLSDIENGILITIQDNAGGIPNEIISHIFEPYFTTKHKSIGTGLGLYIAHKIITQSLKGKIYVKNENEGAKFYIELFYH